MKLIKVEQIKDSKDRFCYSTTLKNTLRDIFGEYLPDGYRARYHGVEIDGIREGFSSFYGHQLLGIKMRVEMLHDRDALRRVMVNKANEIDADAVKAKFKELKVVAEQQAKLQADSESYQATVEACLQRVMTATGAPDKYDYYKGNNFMFPPVEINLNKPGSVSMKATVNGEQLTAIEALMGEQKLELKLVVPEDKAIAVYNILNK